MDCSFNNIYSQTLTFPTDHFSTSTSGCEVPSSKSSLWSESYQLCC